ncbi:uncharacterized protein LOC129601301 [Paramacrobiotus metropolitanus]|uniref:uncharacterized protein LOC129601301 n=1 Tax=Paramacrobiotus metropolitanus TaxID=2943436 RepID=UPI00244606AD|nr:uncharacterized protein LOC129601301 [Paramacrobiotus metropolitanus]
MESIPIYGWLVALAAAMGGFLFGYEMGDIGQVMGMNSFGVEFGIREDEMLNVTLDDGTLLNGTDDRPAMQYENGTLWVDLDGSYLELTNITLPRLPETQDAPDIMGSIPFTFLVGCIAGAACASILADFLGRRYSIFTGSVFYMVGGTMQTGCSHLVTLYIGRVVSGIGVGLMSAVVPLYISETSKTSIRGRLITTFQLMTAFGVLVACSVNAAILMVLRGDLQWRLALGMQLIPAAVLWLLIILLPFSPRWLIDRNRDDEALKTLAKLRNLRPDNEKLLAEFATIKENVNYEKTVGNATWLELLQPGIRNRVALGITLQFFQQWTGCNVMLYYGGKVFSAIGMPVIHAFVTLIILNAGVNFLSTFFAMWLVERIGRKLLLVIGGFLMCLCHALIATFLGLSVNVQEDLVYGALVFIYLFTMVFAATWGPVVWVYQSEIFPMRVRGKATALCTMSNWTWNAIVSKLTPIMLEDIAYYTNVVFSSFCLVMAIFVLIFVPETKGKNLERMDEIFGSIPEAEAHLDINRNKKIRNIMAQEADKLDGEQLYELQPAAQKVVV